MNISNSALTPNPTVHSAGNFITNEEDSFSLSLRGRTRQTTRTLQSPPFDMATQKKALSRKNWQKNGSYIAVLDAAFEEQCLIDSPTRYLPVTKGVAIFCKDEKQLQNYSKSSAP